jgi:hypothetical protein
MIPFSEAAQMAKILQFIPKPPICSICNKPVELLTATTDEDGNIVHEICHWLKMRLKEARKPPESNNVQ